MTTANREGIGGRKMKPLTAGRAAYRDAVIQFKNIGLLDRALARGDNRNKVASRDLARYYALLDSLLPPIVEHLGNEAFAAAMAAMRGFAFTPDTARLAWAQIDGKVSAETVAYVRGLDEASLYAWCDAAERFDRGTLDLWGEVTPKR